jgi:uncharacterized protein CbrC (UPF0167 family)
MKSKQIILDYDEYLELDKCRTIINQIKNDYNKSFNEERKEVNVHINEDLFRELMIDTCGSWQQEKIVIRGYR